MVQLEILFIEAENITQVMVGMQELRASKYLDISASKYHRTQQLAHPSTGALLALLKIGEQTLQQSTQCEVLLFSALSYLVPEARNGYNQSL